MTFISLGVIDGWDAVASNVLNNPFEVEITIRKKIDSKVIIYHEIVETYEPTEADVKRVIEHAMRRINKPSKPLISIKNGIPTFYDEQEEK